MSSRFRRVCSSSLVRCELRTDPAQVGRDGSATDTSITFAETGILANDKSIQVFGPGLSSGGDAFSGAQNTNVFNNGPNNVTITARPRVFGFRALSYSNESAAQVVSGDPGETSCNGVALTLPSGESCSCPTSPDTGDCA